MTTEIPRHHRLLSVLDRLGVRSAHFAGQVPSDFAGLIADSPESIASLSLVCPEHVDAGAFGPVSDRLQAFAGDGSVADHRVRSGMEALAPSGRLIGIDDYRALTWSDVVADHADTVSPAMIEWANQFASDADDLAAAENQFDVDGVRVSVSGSGPPLILAPMALAASQWGPIIDALRQSFTVVQLGGPHLGIIPLLEARGASPGYLQLIAGMFEDLQPSAGDRILDVGCGTGVIERWLTPRLEDAASITGVDINAYLLDEARWLAEGAAVTFGEGDAEHLPFDDNAFDVTFSATVMEEVDAGRMLSELVRVTRPGGRIGVIVRALDLPRWTSLSLPVDLKIRSETWPDPSEGEGCASARLYELMAGAGLESLRCRPDLTAFTDPAGPVEQLLSMMLVAELDEAEMRAWQAARDAAVAAGTFLVTWPHHCAVGTVPAAS